MDYVVGILVLALLVGFFIWLSKWMDNKRRAEVWTGVLEKKWTSDQRDSDGDKVGTNYNVQVKLDGGKTKRLTVPQALFNSLEVGVKLDKQAGAMDPVKVG